MELSTARINGANESTLNTWRSTDYLKKNAISWFSHSLSHLSSSASRCQVPFVVSIDVCVYVCFFLWVMYVILFLRLYFIIIIMVYLFYSIFYYYLFVLILLLLILPSSIISLCSFPWHVLMSWTNCLSLRIHPSNIVSPEIFLLDLMDMKIKNLIAKKICSQNAWVTKHVYMLVCWNESSTPISLCNAYI